jgi:hypothetical protein
MKTFAAAVLVVGAMIVSVLLLVEGQIKSIQANAKEAKGYSAWAALPPTDENGVASQATFQIMDDQEGSVMLSIERPAMTVTIHGDTDSGEPLAVIHPDGFIELGGDPNEAAHRFWAAVTATMPTCYKEESF